MNDQHKDIMIPVVVSKLHFFQVEGEESLGDAVVLCEPLFCIGPEAFQAVDVDFAGGKPLAMVDAQVSVTTEHKSIVASEAVGVNDGSSPCRNSLIMSPIGLFRNVP